MTAKVPVVDWSYSTPSGRKLARYAAYALGQLRALHADHRIDLEFPGAHRSLLTGDLRRAQLDAEN